MLFQVAANGAEYPIAFASKTFTEAEQRWSTLEQELFAMFGLFGSGNHCQSILCANRSLQHSKFVKSSGSESCALEISYATV